MFSGDCPSAWSGHRSGALGLSGSRLLLSVVCQTQFAWSAVQSSAEQQPQEAFQEGNEEKQQQIAAGSTPDQQLSLSDQIVSPNCPAGIGCIYLSCLPIISRRPRQAHHPCCCCALLADAAHGHVSLYAWSGSATSWGLLHAPSSAAGLHTASSAWPRLKPAVCPFVQVQPAHTGQVTCSCALPPLPESTIWHQLSRAWLCAGQDRGAGTAAGGGSKHRCWYL